jgi:hypothetical protein
MVACDCFRADSTALLNHLVDGSLLARYADWLQASNASQAEATQVAFSRRMLELVTRLGAEGMEGVAAHDRAGLDALLTDVFATATWHRWPLPIEAIGSREIDPERAQRGLLGSECEAHGAVLYVVDEDTVALRRSRNHAEIQLVPKHW